MPAKSAPESNLPDGGIFDFSHWSVIRLSGKDAQDYLNRMSTLDFVKWRTDQIRRGCFLTGKSGVISMGYFLLSGGDFLIVVPPNLKDTTLEHIEKFHFAETFTSEDASSEWLLSARVGKAEAMTQGFQWEDPRLPRLTWRLVPRTGKSHDVPLLGAPLFEYYRVCSGLPRVGLDISENDLVLEANLEDAISRNKGCYPGQEVVERIFTYGQVNRKLFPVRLTGQAVPGATFQYEGKDAGVLAGPAIEDPSGSGSSVGLAFIRKAFWDVERFESATLQIERLR